jgi:hypothetical protein
MRRSRNSPKTMSTTTPKRPERVSLQQSKNKKRPVIPEPSPRFVLWSAVVGAFLLAGVLVFDFETGQWPGAVAPNSVENQK